MKRHILITAALTVLLGACAEYGPKSGPVPERPKVTTDGKTITLDQEVLGFKTTGEKIDIVWSLPPDGPFRFVPQRGIVIEGQLSDKLLRSEQVTSVVLDKQDQIVGCVMDESRLKYTCSNKRTQAGVFKYTIRISDGKNEISRDPPIANW